MNRKVKGKYKNGHWVSEFPLRPKTAFGFIYRITNLLNGKEYIGKRQYYRYSKGKRSGETNWKKYTGSCKPLNEDIKKNRKKDFKFEILEEAPTRGWLVYLESNYLHKMDVLTTYITETERKFYNSYINATKFVPKLEHNPDRVILDC